MGSGSPQVSGATGVPNRKHQRLAGMTNMFLYAALVISIWQVSLFIGQHYYAYYGSQHDARTHFNVTRYTLHLGQVLQSTQNSVNENFDAAQNVTSALISRLEALQFQAQTLDHQAKQNHRELLKALEAVTIRLRTLDDSGSMLKMNLTKQEARHQDLARSSMELAQKLKSIEQKLEMFQDANSQLQSKISSLENAAHRMHSHISTRLSSSVEFKPLRDMSKWENKGDNGLHGFLSDIVGRGRKEGPPELFYMPSNTTQGRLLCLQGNHTSDGTLNSYAFAYKEGLPTDAVVLPGTTLIADTYWDFNNPWHSMYNLIQFVYWKMNPTCKSAERLILFHWSELRTDLGYWIKNVFEASNLPTEPERLSYYGRPVCFENAVVSRSGIGGVPGSLMKDIYEEVRCSARRKCGVTDFRSGPTDEVKVRLTLMVRTGARGFVNLTDWQKVIGSECRSEKGCKLTTMFVSNLTFCQQVEIMSKTDILVTVHGAQLTNMIFMSPGSRILEMFPRGWEEYAGHGQFIYSHLANWVGLRHEGYWRDLNTPECPASYGNDTKSCFSFYKDQAVGMNQTYISNWVSEVIDNFSHVQTQAMLPVGEREDPDFQFSWDNSTCACGS
ncbi:hypothetical protein Mapa_008195 [Marchantia paleacea]|nr:hypothetical protein Mapa_008195 [Marchantia paleacea]